MTGRAFRKILIARIIAPGRRFKLLLDLPAALAYFEFGGASWGIPG
jgi:hypothetical protein